MFRNLKGPFKALRPKPSPSSANRSQHSDQDLENSKPIVLRTPFLVLLGFYIVALIVALEYGFRTVTIAEDRFPVLNEYGYGTGSGSYGPFLAPLRKARAVEVLPSTTSELSSAETPPAAGTTPSVFTSFQQNTSSLLSPEPTLMSTSTLISVSSTSSTTGWAGLPTEPMMFGDRIGYPVIHVPSNATLNATRTSLTGIQRRVPAKDKYGQIAGYRIKMSFWHLVYWKSSRPGDIPYVRTPIRFITNINFFPVDYALQTDCTIICDGPAFVFLDPKCWSEWSRVSGAQREIRSQNPGIYLEYNEFTFNGARACAIVAPDIVETKPVTATLFNPLPPITTTELVQEDIVVPGGTGHGSYVPSTYTLSDHNNKPTATIATSVWIPAETPVYQTTIMTLTDDNGRPTATITGTGKSLANQPKTLYDDTGKPTATVVVNGVRWNLRTRTMTGGYGTIPVATFTAFATRRLATITTLDRFGHPVTLTSKFPLVPTVLTMRDSDGVPTATITTQVPTVRGIGVTITDSNGLPIATVYPHEDRGIFRPLDRSEDRGPQTFNPVSWSDYLMAAFLPIIITLPLTTLAQVIDVHVKALLPLKALSRSSDGTSAEDSLFLRTGGIKSFITSWHILFHSREPALLLSQLFILVSSATASFSTEAIGFKLHGGCTVDNFAGCFLEIAIFRTPGRLVQVFLCLSLAVIALLAFAMWHENSGSDARSIAGIAALLTQSSTREAFYTAKVNIKNEYITRDEMIENLSDHRFALRQVMQTPATSIPRHPETTISASNCSSLELASSQSSQQKFAPYSTVRQLSNQPNTDRPQLALVTLPNTEKKPRTNKKTTTEVSSPKSQKMLSIGPVVQDYIRQVLFLLIIIGFLTMILYYELTSIDTAFERFMNSQNLGVRALFASFGLIMSMFWDDYFFNVATKEPYRLLSRRPRLLRIDGNRENNRFFTTPSPLHVFDALAPSSIFYSLQDRSFVVPAVAAVTVLSKFTPPLLSNIPFSPWLTWQTHQACVWSTVGTLVLMILVLGWNLVAVRYPYMPVHPGGEGMGLAGGVYYLCDSDLRVELEELYYRRQQERTRERGKRGVGRLLLGRRWKRGEEGGKEGGEKARKTEEERRGRYVTFGEIRGAQTGVVRVGIGEYGVGRG
ncbi:hypothetical protein QBC36DRAFT_175772 [Triangularia setosa]|uniref:Uncharacterized protein n=1 Tax=Triangularia setosa TaxID=2587417 RepID=A0AAN7AC97_9PEZI|nr:hypothetical protein QBC36DRAFT_175772 [Podospora setosa]